MDLAQEKQLVMAAKKDADSFARLYDYYFPKVYAFVMSKVRNQEDAQDLTSDIFMKTVRSLPAFEWRNVPFGAWVFRIARNRLNDFYRSFHKHNTSDIEEVKQSLHQDESASPKKHAELSELEERVHGVLKDLSERDHEIIRLKFFSELSNKEIAQALDLSESNVAVITFRALKTLKPELENFS